MKAVALALLLFAQTAAEPPAAGFEGRVVSQIDLDIPKGIERAEVLEILTVVSGKPFSQEAVDLDIRRLFASLPVRNVVALAEADGELVRVVFRLEPRTIVGRIVINGNENLDREDLLGVLELKEGAEYREASLAKSAPSIKRLYEENGYYQAAVEVGAPQTKGRQVNIDIRVHEGPRARIGRVSLVGDAGDAAGWVAEALGLERGEPYSDSVLADAKARLVSALAARGYREHLVGEPAVEYNAADNRVNLSLPVRLGPTVEFRFVGNRFFSDRDLIDAVDLESVVQLAPGQVDELASRLRDLYQSWGFHDVAIELSVRGDAGVRIYRYTITEGVQRFISDVRFEGNRSLTSERLREAQSVQERRFFDVIGAPNRGSFPQGRVAANENGILQAYRREGFQSAKIVGWSLAERNDGSLALSYRISEGPQTIVDAIAFSGNVAFDAERLQRELAVNPGRPFNPYAFDDGLENLRRFYSRSGYIEAKVTGTLRYPSGVSAVALDVAVQEGTQYRVGQVFLQGNTRTVDEVVRRNLLVKTGDLVNPDELLATQRKLYRLGIFGAVVVEVLSKDPQARVANVLVRVQEKRNGTVDFGLEVGSAEGVILSAEAAHKNLFGTARSLRGRAEVSYRFDNFRDPKSSLPYPNEFRLETGYREPWLLDSDWAGTLTLITERSRRERSYNLNANRVVVGADREVGERWRLLAHYWWEKDDFFPKRPPADCSEDDAAYDSGDPLYQEDPRPTRGDDPNRCDTNPNADPALVRDVPSNVNLGTYYVAGFEPVLVGDFRNDRFSPTNGSLITYRLFYGLPAVGSDFHFVRQDLTLGNYVELAPRWVIAVGVRAGYIKLIAPTTSLIKPQKYVLGGSNSVRGFGLYEIFVPAADGAVETREEGGLVMANYQAELRFPLVWGLGGVLFQDAGQVWEGVGAISLPLLYTAGPGLRYETPIGPIRLDVGWKLNIDDVPCAGGASDCRVSPYEFHFAIGNAF